MLQVIDCIAPKENLQIIDTGNKVVVGKTTITNADGTTSTVTTTIGGEEFVSYVPKPVSGSSVRTITPQSIAGTPENVSSTNTNEVFNPNTAFTGIGTDRNTTFINRVRGI